jgi:hypothetical protein
VTEPQAERYAPDPHGLWLLYADLQRTGNRLERMARWRIPADDWAHIRQATWGGHFPPIEPPRPPDMQWRLFGLLVDVTPPGEGFPELVLTMDRRMA